MEPDYSHLHPSTLSLLEFFEYAHLPERLQRVSAKFHNVAHELASDTTLNGPELTVALRKLLESKDCAVRASLPQVGR